MGNELARSSCSEAFLKKSTILNVLPVFIASVLVGILVATLLKASDMTVVGIIVCAALVVLMTGSMTLMDRRTKKLYAQTYISVCENGICGKYAQGYLKTVDFEYSYGELHAIKNRGMNLFVSPKFGRAFILLLDDADKIAELVNARM